MSKKRGKEVETISYMFPESMFNSVYMHHALLRMGWTHESYVSGKSTLGSYTYHHPNTGDAYAKLGHDKGMLFISLYYGKDEVDRLSTYLSVDVLKTGAFDQLDSYDHTSPLKLAEYLHSLAVFTYEEV